ncbi:CBS domain-containing protein [candidate division GN15 bacterium]|nr:CBS domain-containing protein [candidate division GN15 bacterium]
MDDKLVKDVMVPLDQCAVVDESASFLDAIRAMADSSGRLTPGRPPYQSVLVVDSRRRVLGKIGQLALLRALEPKYNLLSDLDTVPGAGVNEQFISSIMEHYEFFQDRLSEMCRAAMNIPVTGIMHPIEESVDQDDPLAAAIHKLIVWEALSVPVSSGNDIVGLLRLGDLFSELAATVIELAEGQQ